jgi:hypothetical protein
MWEILLGGLLAAFGGWGAIWFQAKNARRHKMEELMAERKINADAKAYSWAKRVEAGLIQLDIKDVLNIILKSEGWFFSNRLFLPGDFPAKWLELRNIISKIERRERNNIGTPEELNTLHERASELVESAIQKVYTDLNLSRIVIHKVNKSSA